KAKASSQSKKRRWKATANDAAHRPAVTQGCYCPCALGLRIPMAQVINHTREETRLRSAEQKSQHIESRRTPNKHHSHRNGAPGNHDSRDPAPGTHSMQNQIAWHFEKAVTEKKHAGTQPKRSRTESEIGIHLQRRKPDVHPIEPRHDVEDEQKRD